MEFEESEISHVLGVCLSKSRVGVTVVLDAYSLCDCAQKYRAKYEQRAKEKYHYWEIGGEQSIGIGPVRGLS